MMRMTQAEAERDQDWHLVSDLGVPFGIWLRTKMDGEEGTNVCFARVVCSGEEIEWIDREGRTTVTHHSFGAPTHWQWRLSR